MKIYRGEVLSEGIAVGESVEVLDQQAFYKSCGVKKETAKLKKAIESSLEQLKNLKEEHYEDAEYLNIQMLLISDYTLMSMASDLIQDGKSAVNSISEVLDDYASKLARSNNAYLSLRAGDIDDVKNRILENLIGKEEQNFSKDFILFARKIRPSFIIQHKQHLCGVITQSGGFSSHGAILCRQLNIPYMLADIGSLNGKMVIIDTRKQQLIVDPEETEISKYKQTIEELSKEVFKAISHEGYGFYANVSDNSEIEKVVQYGFDGIGLYRTEMIFMNYDRPYTYEEQYQVYHDAVLKMKGKPICFRTFDIGDDKVLPYIKTSKKGIDNYYNNPELFESQIKALLKANDNQNMRIMFPMISTYTEFVFLKKWVLQIMDKMNIETKVRIGMMLETKEALDHIEDFKEVDFISIGTNDLVLSIYHIKRNEQKNKLQKYLDDLVKKLKHVVEFCKEHQICLSICGELAAIEPALRKFMEIGVTHFSIAAPAIRILNKIYKEMH